MGQLKSFAAGAGGLLRLRILHRGKKVISLPSFSLVWVCRPSN
jgi:hypothetical protein